jgi:hypothetical protein
MFHRKIELVPLPEHVAGSLKMKELAVVRNITFVRG